VTTYRNYTAWSYPMSVGPQNVSEGMMAYDPLGPFLFAYGGQLTQAAGCPQTNETWVRANGTWVEITDSAGLPPTARYLSGIAYDAHDSEIVLFGGNSLGGYMSDTWVYRIQPIVARIVAPRNVSGAPFVATFTANATGGSEVYSYNWSFGDGNYSTRGATVNHTYTRVGNYSIVLNVTDLLGRNGSTNLTVHVVRPLSASAGVSATVGAVPFLVNFTVSASGGYGAYTYNWTFGDGASASGTAVSHTYTVAGNYTAAITVRDQSGESNRTFFLIQVAPRLSVSAETSSTSGIVPFEVNFSAIPAGGNPPYGYQWNFGDGGGASSQVASHVYTVAGTYLASVNLTDRLGHRSEYSTVVHAYAPLSVSPQSNVSTGVAPLPVSLTASSSGGDGLGNFTWNFGDGSSPGYGPDQDHVFSTAKTYTVSVTVSDLNRSTTSSLVITTVDPLTLHLSTLTTSGEVGLSFQFTASLAGGEAPIAVSWNFGDGATAVGGFVQNHTYARAGSYTVRLAASDALAERSSASVVVGVVRALSVAVTDAASSVVLGSSDNLTATIAGGGTPYTLVWSGLPPGCPASPTPSITCTPSAVGSYTITLNVSDQFGVHAAGSIAMVVTAPPAPTLSGSGTSSFPLTLLLLGGVAAAVVVVAAVVLLRRRRNVGASPDESPESVEEVPGDESP
jgi:PKD repeat protein